MSRDKLQQLVGSLVKSVEDNEKLATHLLAAKLSKCLEVYPSDQTLGSMARVINKMASNNTFYIRKADLRSLYHKLYSRNTKFAELFQNELGSVETLPTPTVMPRDEATQVNPYEVGDQVLANALNSVFDPQMPVKMYSQSLADKATDSVVSTLDSWSLRPNHITVDAGNEKFIIIKADYETPKGVTSLYVPVEIHNNKVIEASVFMGNAGPQELNHTNIKAYLTTFAGNKSKVTGAAMLTVLTKAASENREVSDAEIALTKLNATRQGKAEFFQNQIVGQKVATAAQADVQLPKSDEFVSFEKQFTTPHGMAVWNYGAAVVRLASEYVARACVSFGYKNPQVVVQGSEHSTIYLNVALNDGRLGFTVPIKVSNGKIAPPAVLLCNGSVGSFSQETINQLAADNVSDYRAAAGASSLSALRPSEVLQNLRDALTDDNHAKAEDALNVLRASGDTKAYATGFHMLMQGLSGKKQATANSKCTHTLAPKKGGVSEHPICAQTGLPAHKVYQDKDGNCRPMYRRSMDETYEGAVFNNSKIFG